MQLFTNARFSSNSVKLWRTTHLNMYIVMPTNEYDARTLVVMTVHVLLAFSGQMQVLWGKPKQATMS